ncbi:MAG: hypothetical protein ABGY41_11710, partial [Candidatus Poribacteria bacterium]
IDVQRGAVSTAGGAGALAGTANIRTLDVQDILRPSRTYGALTHVGWGSNGVGWAEMGAAAAKAGKVSIAGAISKHDERNYETGEGLTVPHTGEDLISGLAKAHIDISPGQRLSFGTVLYNNEFTANSYEQTVKSNTYYSNYVYNPAANNLVDFRQALGHTVLLDLSSVWCGPCNKAAAESAELLHAMQEIAPSLLVTILVQNIGGSPASSLDAAQWASDYSAEYPVLVDTSLETTRSTWGQPPFPTFWLIAPTGEIFDRFTSVPSESDILDGVRFSVEEWGDSFRQSSDEPPVDEEN